MPVMGPDYSKDKANEVAEKMWQFLLNKHKLLNMPINSWGVRAEDRAQLKQEFVDIIHKVYRLDCYEGF